MAWICTRRKGEGWVFLHGEGLLCLAACAAPIGRWAANSQREEVTQRQRQWQQPHVRTGDCRSARVAYVVFRRAAGTLGARVRVRVRVRAGIKQE